MPPMPLCCRNPKLTEYLGWHRILKNWGGGLTAMLGLWKWNDLSKVSKSEEYTVIGRCKEYPQTPDRSAKPETLRVPQPTGG